MFPAAADVAHDAPPSPLESLLPSATDDEILGLVTPRKSSPRARAAVSPAGAAGLRNAGILPAGFDSSAAPDESSPTTTLSSRQRAEVWPDEGSASALRGENQQQIPRRPQPGLARDDNSPHTAPAEISATAIPEEIRAALDASPELQSAWQDAQSYRETFSSPQAAKEGAALLADLNRMDALFFSPRPEDHAELARSIAALDPAAFASLAQAIAHEASAPRAAGVSPAPSSSPSRASFSAPLPATTPSHHDAPRRSSPAGAGPDQFTTQTPRPAPAPAAENSANLSTTFPLSSRQRAALWPDEGSASALRGENLQQIPRRPEPGLARDDNFTPGAQQASTSVAPPQTPTPAQAEFFHATNAAAVESVLEAIESQVERLLPEGVSKSARARVVGEIYRELDTTLRSNRQLGQQMRDAFRAAFSEAAAPATIGYPNAGNVYPDAGRIAGQQRAIVSLVTGRARQALPAVAKRVLNEWTSTIVAANNDRRTRQRTAEHRVDIAGSSGSSTSAGSTSAHATSPREINYARMSDADILNL